MPFGGLLEGASDRNDEVFAPPSGHDFDANREALFAETGGDGDRGKAEEIADTAQADRFVLVEVGVEVSDSGWGDDGVGRGDEHVEIGEDLFHFGGGFGANPHRSQVVDSGHLERVPHPLVIFGGGQFGRFALGDELLEGRTSLAHDDDRSGFVGGKIGQRELPH